MADVTSTKIKKKAKKIKEKGKEKETEQVASQQNTTETNASEHLAEETVGDSEDELTNSKKEGRKEEQPTIPTSSTRIPFTSLPLSPPTQRALAAMKLTHTTPIQTACIPLLLASRPGSSSNSNILPGSSGIPLPTTTTPDILAAARTGSGKTLAFLLPAIELLHRLKFKPHNGTGVIIISPTRELALQIFGVVREVMSGGGEGKGFTQTFGILMGGANRRAEEEKLVKGVNIVVATPGRLWDHLRDTKGFVTRNLKTLIIDEADRILEIGFEQQMRDIIAMLPKERQTLLFSATQTTKVTDLARVSLRPNPILIDVDKEQATSTVSTLSQGYVTCPPEHRFLLLFTFLKKNLKKKIIVFFSSCNSVKYHGELLNYIDIPVLDLHGKQKQQKRTSTFFEFMNAPHGALLCTDVAARGLDIPRVDYIIQYDPPDDPRDYIHRVGRTARAGNVGKSLLFLMESELGFLRYLKEAKVPLNEFVFPRDRVIDVQAQLESLLQKNYHLYRSATLGYRAYLQSYASYQLKNIFDVNKLDLARIAKAFGFKVPPRVSLNVGVGVGGGAGAVVGERRRRENESEVESEDMEGEHDSMDEEEDGKKRKKRRTEISRRNGSRQHGNGSVSRPMRVRDEGWSKKKREEVFGKKRLLKERHFGDKNMGRGKLSRNWSR